MADKFSVISFQLSVISYQLSENRRRSGWDADVDAERQGWWPGLYFGRNVHGRRKVGMRLHAAVRIDSETDSRILLLGHD